MIFSLLLLSACSEKTCRETKFEQAKPLTITADRLEKELFSCKSIEEVERFLRSQPVLTNIFLNGSQYPDLRILSQSLFGRVNNAHMDTLYQEVNDQYDNFSPIENELGLAFANIKTLYPDFVIPKVQTVVTGLHRDLLVTDSVIIIGLDFFLGENATYKPNPKEIPEYMLRRYTQNHLTVHIINAIAQNFIQINKNDNTMLAEMLDYGKCYLFTSQVLPCKEESIILGYSEAEEKEILANEKIIWSSFLQNEVIYETDHMIKNKFIGERPKIPEIGNSCPGRIGRWIGYRILTSYMENQQRATLRSIMSEKKAKEIFLNSKYNPLR